MRPNKMDGILKDVKSRVDSVVSHIADEYKGVKPFDKEEIPAVDRIWAYQNLTPQDMNILIQKHGKEAMNSYIAEMEQLKAKRAAHGGKV